MPAAALVAVAPVPDIPSFLEANRGQARADVLFLSRSPASSLAITAQALLYSPLDVTLSFVGNNAAPQVSTSDALSGFVNVYSGADPRKWVQKAPLYSSATLREIYPGTDAQYVASSGGLVLRLVCRPGCDMNQPLLALSKVRRIDVGSNGWLEGPLGTSKMDARVVYLAPVAYQETRLGRSSVPVAYDVRGTDRFGFQVSHFDTSIPLYVEMVVSPNASNIKVLGPSASDQAGNVYLTTALADAAGKDTPFPDSGQVGCGSGLFYTPLACKDVAVYKFSATGELIYATYLAGRTSETPGTLALNPSGAVVVTGATDSSDFPVTANAYQRDYAGPSATFTTSYSYETAGDLFAITLDPVTGASIGSTFAGSPDADTLDKAYVGGDGSVYLLPRNGGGSFVSPRLPVTAGALQTACAGNPCASAYVIRLAPSLDRAVYATYLPGTTWATKLHTDGSLYFAGRAGAGFPVTASAYQKEPKGSDAFIARLDPSGTSLLFGTYFGTGKIDAIYRIAVAPDGAVWADVNSSIQCCGDSEDTLIRLDSTGSKLLFTKHFAANDLTVDDAGNLLSLSSERVTVSPDAFLANPCGPLVQKITPAGEQVFATYLPANFLYAFTGFSKNGNPLVASYTKGVFEVVPSQPTGIFAGCVVNSGDYGFTDTLSPGEIVTIFGSGMGPREGVSYEWNGEHVPTSLAGTRVLLNGQAIPILYASYWQVNAIVPYSMPVNPWAGVQIETESGKGNEATLRTQQAGIALFTSDGSGRGQAAALNEDGTANSPGNPAKPGSVVMLFGTGGGTTTPPGVTGEATPLELRPLDTPVEVSLVRNFDERSMTVEYAGAAPGLTVGVIQINIRLPETIPDIPGFSRSVIPVRVTSVTKAGHVSSDYPLATIAVR